MSKQASILRVIRVLTPGDIHVYRVVVHMIEGGEGREPYMSVRAKDELDAVLIITRMLRAEGWQVGEEV